MHVMLCGYENVLIIRFCKSFEISLCFDLLFDELTILINKIDRILEKFVFMQFAYCK